MAAQLISRKFLLSILVVLSCTGFCSELGAQTSTTNAPAARYAHTAVWTGTEMIVWGGTDGSTLFNNGGRYNPANNTWSAMSSVGAPSGRVYHTAVWTGTEMIVWGGSGAGDGARYNPSTDTWTAVTNVAAPGGREQHSAVWTGNRMIIWGGLSGSTPYADGYSYNPVTDSWTVISNATAPGGRSGHSAVWDSTEMLVWGGAVVGGVFNNGAGYNPSTDTWATMGATGAPAGRSNHAAVWTGSLMVLWGGIVVPGSTTVNTGGRYNPSTANWQSTALTGAPSARWYHTGVWTGSRMVVWGGSTAGSIVSTDSGGLYDPTGDTWLPSSLSGAPSPRAQHTAVWTGVGGRMIVWGGWNGTAPTNTGGVLDPLTNTWGNPSAPTVTGVLPSTGSTSGGTTVTISGTNFTGTSSVTFNGSAATAITVVSATSITCTTPAGVAGAASVIVTTPNGTNTPNSAFTYTSGSSGGGGGGGGGDDGGCSTGEAAGGLLLALIAIAFVGRLRRLHRVA